MTITNLKRVERKVAADLALPGLHHVEACCLQSIKNGKTFGIFPFFTLDAKEVAHPGLWI